MNAKIALKKVIGFLVYAVFRNRFKLLAGKPTINGLCIFRGLVTLGDNVHFNGVKIMGSGGVDIGSNFHSGKGLLILTQSHNYQGGSLPYDAGVVSKRTIIGDNVWIGINVIILPGIKVGEGAIIQAGSVVSKNVEPLAIVGGNPALKFRERDREHYEKLKNESKYH
tara:strand:+ start:2130 stop:2630 length:501 start_codon:yes stop_codon:yes gene_type:complete